MAACSAALNHVPRSSTDVALPLPTIGAVAGNLKTLPTYQQCHQTNWCRGLAALMGVFVGAVFFDVSFDVSGAQNRVGECVAVHWG
jgi:hypothetical protein